MSRHNNFTEKSHELGGEQWRRQISTSIPSVTISMTRNLASITFIIKNIILVVIGKVGIVVVGTICLK